MYPRSIECITSLLLNFDLIAASRGVGEIEREGLPFERNTAVVGHIKISAQIPQGRTYSTCRPRSINQGRVCVCGSMSKRRRTTNDSAAVSLSHLFQTAVPELSKGNEELQSSPHCYDTGHEAAAPFTEEIELTDQETYLFDGGQDPSYLLRELHDQALEFFTYQNETKVQNLVALCLKDALRSQGLFQHFGVENEFSIFSYRPDIIIVSHNLKGIILVIEVKKPGLEVFTSHEVAGQKYDYLIGELLSGVSTPIGVLTSYDEMCIAFLDDDEGKSLDILKRNAANLGNDIDPAVLKAFGIDEDSPTPPSSPPPGHTSNSRRPSPESKLNPVFASSLNNDRQEDRKPSGKTSDDEKPPGCSGQQVEELSEKVEVESDDDDDDDDWNRSIFYTQTFGREAAMKALVLAIRCGLEAVARSEPRNAPLNGASAQGSCAMVNEHGLVYTNIPEAIKFNYRGIPSANTKIMYLWRDIGRGSKGRVFLACNSSGRACAVKFFLIDYNTYHRRHDTSENRENWRQSQMTIKKKEAEKEYAHWVNAYGGAFKDQVRVVRLNNLWCLMMPYFDQVSPKKRSSVLKVVRDHLEEFKASNLNYAIEELRWRHVGVRDEGCFIFDLGSLESRDASEIDVDASIDALQQKI